MQKTIVVKGRMVGPRSIELDEAVPSMQGAVEVTLRAGGGMEPSAAGLLEFVRSLPPGTRSKDDIDRQIQEDRESWGDR